MRKTFAYWSFGYLPGIAFAGAIALLRGKHDGSNSLVSLFLAGQASSALICWVARKMGKLPPSDHSLTTLFPGGSSGYENRPSHTAQKAGVE